MGNNNNKNEKYTKEDMIKIILEVQHLLHIADNEEEYNKRKEQLEKLLAAMKKKYDIK